MDDLSQLDDLQRNAEAGKPMTVLHPTKGTPLKNADGTDMTITLRGRDSDAYRKQLRKNINARIAAQQQSGTQVAADAAEKMERDGLEMIVAATVAWNITVDGEQPPCATDKVRSFYQRFPPLQEQADKFVADRGNFLSDPT